MAIRTRRTRRQTEGRFRLKKPVWFDPYPAIPGTEPEKRIFAELIQMGIYFIYQGQVPEFEKGNLYWQMAPPGYKPDFVLPEYRLIIDPFSPFHHSLDAAVKRDIEKVVAYGVAGYAYYHPWAIGGNEWSWDQYRDDRKKIDLGTTRRYKKVYTTVYRRKGKDYLPGNGVTGAQLEAAGYKKRRVVTDYKVTERRNVVSMYGGVNAARNKYRRLSREIGGTVFSTHEMIMSIPEIRRGPLYKLTDPRDIKAKQSPGYRVGQYVGAGATSVAASNTARARTENPPLTIRYGNRRTIRRS